ncbi:VanW family protein [Clostridium estertheticum]|uniref:VanW family protein n=1 Tax=Clostridium estertheticum TaxID=238834 RepID=UPI0013EEA56A|nr:VanW family protein [Clostridium estertheticum]MBZ9607838.1 VanW family protein [Clostridium estertheticum]
MSLNIMSKASKKRKKRLRTTLIIVGIIVSLIGVQLIIMYSTISKYDLKIYPEVWVEDINLGGMTKDEAKNAIIKNRNNIIAKKDITINLNDKHYTVHTSKLGIKHDYNVVINKAYDIGRKENLFKNYFAITSPGKRTFDVKYTYNYAILDTLLKDIAKDNNKNAIDATIFRNNSGQLVITEDEYGLSVDSASLKKAIINKVNNIEKDQNLVIESKLKKVEPKIKENDLKCINAQISSVTTNFRNSNENRSENIRVSSNSINGKLLMPGDIFSFNDIVGDRTIERGYKTSKEIIGDKYVDGIGGGVCQVSTTLYNAVLRTNLTSVERYPHTMHSSYIGAGLDATVAYGSLDYRFKNTTSYPIYIESAVHNKNVTFSIYSNSILNNKKYDIVNEIVGKKVNVFRITYENGNQVSKTFLYTDKLS